jgi:hypothetical protein
MKIDLKEMRGGWTEFVQLRQGSVVGSCEHGNKPLVSITDGEFLDYLRNYWLLKKDST